MQTAEQLGGLPLHPAVRLRAVPHAARGRPPAPMRCTTAQGRDRRWEPHRQLRGRQSMPPPSLIVVHLVG